MPAEPVTEPPLAEPSRLETAMAAPDLSDDPVALLDIDAMPETKPQRGKLCVSDSVSRERIVLDPGETGAECGGQLRLVGEDVAEILELVTARLKVIETARQIGKKRGVKEGRIWTYVRDPRPWGGSDRPVIAYWFSRDRRGINPQTHLAKFPGILQADVYGEFRAFY
ncbi:hypothetical protein AA0535_2174 [Asaia krungthepensis NRIC 0535]|uniref:Transposase IS66 central domain-containing protein n=1 Tax=Asaia krungthepensis NRIC 0535 TaxID=1307925 RepID=A0ABQ0Q4F3_9PROT|nr:hypothetical protein AA0535_2174 [Asaia krungthepensis NRIC 0535]